VKTLSDLDVGAVNFKPVRSTVRQLIQLGAPSYLPNNRRVAPVELTVYVVRAAIVATHNEEDQDIHVVIADPDDPTKTMITEVVSPGCEGAIGSIAVERLKTARQQLNDLFSPATPQSWFAKRLVHITGVGFFDFQHGQDGVAPNAIELHPVLDIQRVD